MRLYLAFIIFFLSLSSVFGQPQERVKNIYSNYLRGLSYTVEGNYRAALREFQKAKSLDPASIQIRIKIATLLIRLGEMQSAEKELKEAKKTDPSNIDVSLALVILYAYAQKDREFEAEYEQFLRGATKLMPQDIRISEYLAQFYFIKKNFSEAAKVYETIIKNNPNYVEGVFWLGQIYEEMNRRPDAIAAWKHVLELDQSHAPTLNALGYIYAEEGTLLDEAESMVKKALEKEPDNGAYLDSLGWVYFKKKDYARAQEYLTKANVLLKDPVLYEHLGDLNVELQRMDEARKYYTEGNEQFPDDKRLQEKLKQYGKKDQTIKK